MNKVQEIMEHNLEVAHKFNVLEVALFEMYLFLFGILLGILFPQILNISPWVYGLLALIGTIYMLWTYLSKNNNIKKRIERKGFHVHLTKNFGALDFGIYKLTLLLFGIFILQLFPLLGSIHIAWYTAFVGFGMGYFIKSICNKK